MRILPALVSIAALSQVGSRVDISKPVVSNVEDNLFESDQKEFDRHTFSALNVKPISSIVRMLEGNLQEFRELVAADKEYLSKNQYLGPDLAAEIVSTRKWHLLPVLVDIDSTALSRQAGDGYSSITRAVWTKDHVALWKLGPLDSHSLDSIDFQGDNAKSAAERLGDKKMVEFIALLERDANVTQLMFKVGFLLNAILVTGLILQYIVLPNIEPIRDLLDRALNQRHNRLFESSMPLIVN